MITNKQLKYDLNVLISYLKLPPKEEEFHWKTGYPYIKFSFFKDEHRLEEKTYLKLYDLSFEYEVLAKHTNIYLKYDEDLKNLITKLRKLFKTYHLCAIELSDHPETDDVWKTELRNTEKTFSELMDVFQNMNWKLYDTNLCQFNRSSDTNFHRTIYSGWTLLF